MANFNLIQRWQRMNNGNPPPTSADLADLVDTTQFASQVPFLQAFGSTGAAVSGVKTAYGSSTLASGVATVATGLATIISFVATVAATGFATGATEVGAIYIKAATGVAATGDISVGGWGPLTATGSVSGTAKFDWIAIGT